MVGDLALKTMRASGVELSIGANELGVILVAIEDGLRVHRLIDPTSTSPDAFTGALHALLDAFGALGPH